MHFSFQKSFGEILRGEEKKCEMSEISISLAEFICRLLPRNSSR